MKDLVQEGWKEVTLGEVCEIYQPKTISAKEMVPDGPYPVFGANGIIGRYTEYNHEEPQLLVTCRGATCGSVNVSEPFSWITGNAMVIRPKVDDLSLRYVEYFFRGAVDLDGVITGAAQPQITRKSLAPVRIGYPSLEEQQRIVAVLDEAFEGLARARAHAEANLQNARELFSSVLDEVFSNSPTHWTRSTLGKTCTFIGGSQPPKSEFVYTPAEDLVRLIQIRDYKSDKNIVYIPRAAARRFCEEDDVMIGRYGPPLFQILRGIKGAYNVALMKAVPKSDLMSKDFLYYFLQNRQILQYIIEASSRAAGQIGLNKATLEPYPISYPDGDEQSDVVERLDAAKINCEKAIEQYLITLQDFDDLRRSLLQKAFAGELT